MTFGVFSESQAQTENCTKQCQPSPRGHLRTTDSSSFDTHILSMVSPAGATSATSHGSLTPATYTCSRSQSPAWPLQNQIYQARLPSVLILPQPLLEHRQELSTEQSPDTSATQSSLEHGPILLSNLIPHNFRSTHCVSPAQGKSLPTRVPWCPGSTYSIHLRLSPCFCYKSHPGLKAQLKSHLLWSSLAGITRTARISEHSSWFISAYTQPQHTSCTSCYKPLVDAAWVPVTPVHSYTVFP